MSSGLGEGFGGIMQKAQEMQEKVQKIQSEIANMEVTGESGAGLVKICLLYTSPSPRDRG